MALPSHACPLPARPLVLRWVPGRSMRHPLLRISLAPGFCRWFLFLSSSARPFAGCIGGIDQCTSNLLGEFTNLRMIDNSWIAWNVPAGNFHQGQVVVISALTTLLTVALVVLAAAIAFWRLLSHKWQMGHSRIRDWYWPATAATVLFLAGWFKASVLPYRIPGDGLCWVPRFSTIAC